METRKFTLYINPERKIRGVLGVPRSTTMAAILVLGHGANNDMDQPLIAGVHERLAREGVVTVRFNFPYAQEGKKHPDPDAVLEGTFRLVLEYVGEMEEFKGLEMFLGGKSMGARLASQLVAQDVGANGLIFLGYPLHAPGKLDNLRDQHLSKIPCPMLFVEGSRDPFCNLERLGGVMSRLPVRSDLHVIPGGGHSFETASGSPGPETLDEITRVILSWLESL